MGQEYMDNTTGSEQNVLQEAGWPSGPPNPIWCLLGGGVCVLCSIAAKHQISKENINIIFVVRYTLPTKIINLLISNF